MAKHPAERPEVIADGLLQSFGVERYALKKLIPRLDPAGRAVVMHSAREIALSSRELGQIDSTSGDTLSPDVARRQTELAALTKSEWKAVEEVSTRLAPNDARKLMGVLQAMAESAVEYGKIMQKHQPAYAESWAHDIRENRDRGTGITLL